MLSIVDLPAPLRPNKARLGFVSSALGQFQSTLDKQVVEDVVISGAFNSIGIYQQVEPEVRERLSLTHNNYTQTKRAPQ